jgi:putative membrane protein
MRLLVLNVDRDDDLGRKTGIKGPVLGREDMLRAAAALALADPEEADANGMFAAVKEYDEILKRKEEYDADEVYVGALTGHIREGSFADNAMSQQFDDLRERTRCDAVILVSDGNEDEHVLPILQTRVKVNGVRRVIVKQARTLEGVLGLFSRLIHDEKLQRRFFLPLALLFIAAGAAVLFRKPELFVASGLFLAAVYIMVQVLNLGRPIEGLLHGLSVQMRTGKLSLFASILSFVLVVVGGFMTIQAVEPASTLGTARYTVLFAQAMFWYLVGAVALIIIGRGMDRKVRGEQVGGRHWERLLFVLAGATLAYSALHVLDGWTRPSSLGLPQLFNMEFLTLLFFAGFLLFTGLIARHYFQQVAASENAGPK